MSAVEPQFLPCVDPNDAPRPATLAIEPFAYLGTPLTLEEFCSYVASYDFGTIPPDQVVIHNTANPDASWAPLSTSDRTWWDRDERGLTTTAIRNKRQKQLDAIKAYYVGLGWDAGPHLFIDDRWIWLFTPMADIGIHAKEGNFYRDAAGRLHYSIGIEAVGWFGKQGWPLAMQALLRGAVQALQARLGTFEIVYKPAPLHQPAAHQGSIAFHRDFNKPQCPGAVITPEYAIPILSASPSAGAGLYRVLAPMWISETSTYIHGPIALEGTGVIFAGNVVMIDEVKAGIAHLQDGRGFLPLGGLERI